MSIQEISLEEHVAHIAIDGKEYLIMGNFAASLWSVTVIAGRQWIASRRALGKTFFNTSDLAANYKKHGKILAEYANRLNTGKAS